MEHVQGEDKVSRPLIGLGHFEEDVRLVDSGEKEEEK